MLIVCPACASEYEIETDHVGPEGRAVRCAACRETWFVMPEGLPTADMSADEPAARTNFDEGPPWTAADPGVPSAAPGIIDQPSPPRRVEVRAKGRTRLAWADGGMAWTRLPRSSAALAAGLVLFVAVPLALLGRATVVRAMPRSAGLFAAVGLPVNLRGIEIRDVVAFRDPAGPDRPAQLVVEGDLVGVARGRVATPPLEIEILDAAERSLFRWTAPAPRAALESAETARFRASLPSPPLQGSRVEVRFAEAGGGAGRRMEAGMETGLAEASAPSPAPAAGPRTTAGRAGH